MGVAWVGEGISWPRPILLRAAASASTRKPFRLSPISRKESCDHLRRMKEESVFMGTAKICDQALPIFALKCNRTPKRDCRKIPKHLAFCDSRKRPSQFSRQDFPRAEKHSRRRQNVPVGFSLKRSKSRITTSFFTPPQAANLSSVDPDKGSHPQLVELQSRVSNPAA